MQPVTSLVVQFRGSYYDFGYYQAQQILKTNYLENRMKMRASIAQKFHADVTVVTNLLNLYAPSLVDELTGLADGLNLPFETVILYFGGYYENQKSGCSIVLQKDFIVRNYDQEPSTYDGRYVLFQPNNGGYATIGPTMQIVGRTDGMNEHGLVIGYNFVNSRKHGDGFVCNMIARIVLEACKTTDEAITLLEKIPHKHAFNYCLLDASGKTAVVEASSRHTAVRDALVCTNHFEKLTDENRYTMADSIRRVELMQQVAKDQPSVIEAYSLLNSSDGGVFAKKYSAWDGTIHTATYEPQKLFTAISFGSNRMPMPFNFNKWIQGDDLAVTKLKGVLQAKKPFAIQ